MVDDRGHQTVMCEENHPAMLVQRPIVACTDHHPRGTVDRYEMEKIAWTIERKKGQFVGFAPPKKADT